MNRRKLLFVLLVILVAAALYAILGTPTQERVSRPAGSRIADADSSQGKEDVKQSLRLELLDREDTKFEKVGRDIFNFYVPPPPPPPPPPVVKTPLPPPPPPVIKPPPVEVAPTPRLASFTFLGLLDIEDRVSVFLSSGDDLYIVKLGDVFGKNDEFEVRDMTEDEIQISQQDRAGLIHVALREKEKKAADASSPGAVAEPVETSTRRRVPPIKQPQFRSFKRYEP